MSSCFWAIKSMHTYTEISESKLVRTFEFTQMFILCLGLRSATGSTLSGFIWLFRGCRKSLDIVISGKSTCYPWLTFPLRFPIFLSSYNFPHSYMSLLTCLSYLFEASFFYTYMLNPAMSWEILNLYLHVSVWNTLSHTYWLECIQSDAAQGGETVFLGGKGVSHSMPLIRVHIIPPIGIVMVYI